MATLASFELDSRTRRRLPHSASFPVAPLSVSTIWHDRHMARPAVSIAIHVAVRVSNVDRPRPMATVRAGTTATMGKQVLYRTSGTNEKSSGDGTFLGRCARRACKERRDCISRARKEIHRFSDAPRRISRQASRAPILASRVTRLRNRHRAGEGAPSEKNRHESHPRGTTIWCSAYKLVKAVCELVKAAGQDCRHRDEAQSQTAAARRRDPSEGR